MAESAAARTARRPTGSDAFFPTAAAYAAVVLPLSVLSLTGVVAGPPGLQTPAGHAHELLFGFAFAAVAGYQLGPTSWAWLGTLLGLWGIGRIAFLAAPLGIVAAAADALFAALLVWRVAPRLFASVKKPRNYALPVAVSAIGAAAIVFHITSRAGAGEALHDFLFTAVLVFALLMLFMGGRIIAPAAAGQFYRQGITLEARVQPKLEGALIVAMIVAIAVAVLAPWAWAAVPVAAACGVAGLLALIRLARWQLWGVRARPDLLCLGVGYAWVAVGLIAVAAALLSGRHLTTALHLITTGAIGTLTLNVMFLVWVIRAGRPAARARLPVFGTVLVAAAAVARAAAGFAADEARLLLWFASICWSSAFVLLLFAFLRLRRPAGVPRAS